MSDQATRQRGATRSPRARRKGAPRGGRHGLSRPTVAPEATGEPELAQIAPAVAPARSRRVTAERPAPAPVLSREAEMAYVRADMRKLLVIATLLFAMMLVILVLIGR